MTDEMMPCPTCSEWTAEEIADMAGDGDRCPTCDGKGVVPVQHLDGKDRP